MIKNIEMENKLIIGERGPTFFNFLRELLQRTSLSTKIIDELLKEEDVIQMYYDCFSHKSFHVDHNYEYYEMIGDVSCNKIIVWYLKDRFPFLCNSEGVKVLARLRINLVSKLTFSTWAKNLDFLRFISMDTDTKVKMESSILEDVFEAFVGVTELMIDKYIRSYSGIYFVHHFIKSILDEETISLSYKLLYDPVTRLKETMDHFNSNLHKSICPFIHGSISFSHEKVDAGQYIVRLHQNSSSKKEVLLQEKGKSINDLKYHLSQQYLDFLELKGFSKMENKYYQKIENQRVIHEENK